MKRKEAVKEIISLLFAENPWFVNYEKALEIKHLITPSSLYKYYSFDSENYHLNNLGNNVVYLSAASSFNDPYECFLTFSYQEVFKEYLNKKVSSLFSIFDGTPFELTANEKESVLKAQAPFEELMKIVLRKDTQLSDETHKKMPSSFEKAFVSSMKKKMSEGNPFSEIQKNTRVCSFSETKKSILMWSHYADNHKGFCVEYDFKNMGINNFDDFLFPVIYRKKLPDITDFLKDFSSKSFLSRMTLYAGIIKSSEWKYEKEWRLIFPSGFLPRNATLSCPVPKAVYMGTRISEENKERLKEICKEKRIKLYQAKLKNDEYKLVFNIEKQ